jgi:peptide/nickel transport system permease protein
MAVVSYLAPLLANNKPLLIRYEGRLHFTAFRDLPPFSFWLKPDAVALRLQADPDWLYGGASDRSRVDFAILPPVPFSPYQTSMDRLHLPPGLLSAHRLGCDDVGRDVLARMIHGTKVSLLVGVLAMGLALLVGVGFGALGGYAGGWVDALFVSRVIEVMLCFPTFFFILTVTAVMDPKYLSLWSVVLVIGLTTWPSVARYTRAEFLRLRGAEFIEGARALGAGHLRLVVRHMLPNAAGPLIVNATFGMAGAILAEAALSFLGVGIQPPEPSWGGIMSLVTRYWSDWWLGLFPGAAIFAAVLAYNRLGDALRDALDAPAGTGE